MAARLWERYRDDVVPALREQFGYANPMSVPRLQKVTISMGVGDAHREANKLEECTKHLALIGGQKPVVCRARKSVSNFKIRTGMAVGLKVTLRRARMYEFLDRLVTVAIPRMRDFRGLSPSGFDGRGNYNMGLDEQTVFPEVDPDSVTSVQGMNIALITSAATDEEARELLDRLGVPFRSE
jgi:large subunit ribosomal protein L5